MEPDARLPVLVVDPLCPSGGRRIQALLPRLRSYGIEPIVLSTKPDSPVESIAKARLQWHVVEDRRVDVFAHRFAYRSPDSQHYGLLRLLSLPERLLYSPDSWIRWTSAAAERASQLVVDRGIRTVLTWSPPESTHGLGLILKQRFGLRWVADFTDLWTQRDSIYRPATRWHDRRIRRLERQYLDTADVIIASTPEAATMLHEGRAVSPSKLTVVTNFFDPEDAIGQSFEVADNPRPDRKSADPNGEPFTLGYFGTLDKHALPWRLLLGALSRFVDEVGPEAVRFVVYGHAFGEVRKYLRGSGLEGVVELHGYRPHRSAFQQVASAADMCVLLLYDTPIGRVMGPSKIYSYLLMGKPILAIAPEEGSVARILRETRSGRLIAPGLGENAVLRGLRDAFDQWSRGELTISDSRAIDHYSVDAQAQVMAKALIGTNEPSI